jgi:hypothetical protein
MDQAFDSIRTYVDNLLAENEHLRTENTQLRMDRGIWLQNDLSNTVTATATAETQTSEGSQNRDVSILKRSVSHLDFELEEPAAKFVCTNDNLLYDHLMKMEMEKINTIPYISFTSSKLSPYLVDGKFYVAPAVFKYYCPQLPLIDFTKCNLQNLKAMCCKYRKKYRKRSTCLEKEIMDKAFAFVDLLNPVTFLTYRRVTMQHLCIANTVTVHTNDAMLDLGNDTCGVNNWFSELEDLI